MNRFPLIFLLLFALTINTYSQERQRARDYGIRIGVLPTGRHNAITDVQGVMVGHTTLIHEEVRTGITAIFHR